MARETDEKKHTHTHTCATETLEGLIINVTNHEGICTQRTLDQTKTMSIERSLVEKTSFKPVLNHLIIHKALPRFKVSLNQSTPAVYRYCEDRMRDNGSIIIIIVFFFSRSMDFISNPYFFLVLRICMKQTTLITHRVPTVKLRPTGIDFYYSITTSLRSRNALSRRCTG